MIKMNIAIDDLNTAFLKNIEIFILTIVILLIIPDELFTKSSSKKASV